MLKTPHYIDTLDSYEPGKSIAEVQKQSNLKKVIKLASNENPLGPSPKAKQAMRAALDQVHRYPDSGMALKEALAKKFEVKSSHIILGAGSDSLMLALVRAFVTEGGEVATSEGTFPQFSLMPQSRGAVVKKAPLKDFCYDLHAIQKLVSKKTELIFLSNPNNPTSTMFTHKEWEDFYEKVPKNIVIVLDEAYAEFASDHPGWPRVPAADLENVVCLRTFSKAYGLAGVRLGYGIGAESLVRTLHKVKLPFEPSALALVAGEAALRETDFLEETLRVVREGRAQLEAGLQKLGIRFLPGVANFMLIELETPKVAEKMGQELLAEGVLVRPLKAFGLPRAFRVTIGLKEENEKFLEALQRIAV